MTTMRTTFHVGHSVENALRKAALTYGAGRAELASIDRLVEFRGELVDIARLEPLAKMAGLLWREMFPELEIICAAAPLDRLFNAVQRWRSCPITDINSHTGSYITGFLAGTVARCAEAAVDAGVPAEAVRQILRKAS